MSHQLIISLLGSLDLKQNKQSLSSLASTKGKALFVYLLYTQRPQTRSKLAEMLWPGRTSQQAQRNLRTALTRLRKVLDPYILSQGQTLAFDKNQPYWVDVFELKQQLVSADIERSLTETQARELAQILSLYQGELLAGFELSDAPDFEAWLSFEREQLQRLVLNGFHQVSRYYLENGEYDVGIRWTQQLLALNEFDEKAHIRLLHLLIHNGQRDAALAHYDAYVQLLSTELGIKPDAHLETLQNQIKAGTWPPAIRRNGTAKLAQPPPSPYLGLAAFTEQEANVFFGRDVFLDTLLSRVQQQPLVAVVGPSGSGKSSVVQAGLIPRLRHLQGKAISGPATTLDIALLRPRHQPFLALAQAFRDTRPELVPSTQKLASQLQRMMSLTPILEPLSGQPTPTCLLLVIDQFEELFTLCQPEIQQTFIQMLLQGLATQQPGKLQITLTLRADFMGQMLAYRSLADALQPGLLLLGPMSTAELQQAIEQPAQQQGVAFEAGLVQRLQHDVGQEAGRLPLLQFTLATLWAQISPHQFSLTHQSYEAIGGVAGALSEYAEQVYQALPPTEQVQMQEIFIQLVQPSDHTPDIRRMVLRTELVVDHWPLVQKLIHTRLIVARNNIAETEAIEVIHEVLIRVWPRWQQWLARDRDFRSWQERLRLLAKQWEVTGHDQGGLLRGALLTEAEYWTKNHASSLSQAEQIFVNLSLAQRDEALQAEQTQRQQEKDKLAKWWQRIIEFQEKEAAYQREITTLKNQLSSNNP